LGNDSGRFFRPAAISNSTRTRTFMRISRNAIAGLTALCCVAVAQDARASDLVLINGRIYTAGAEKWAEAIAITGGRIEAVGSNAQALKTKTAKTQVVDLKGRFVSPGFVDDHTHIWFGSLALTNLNLSTPQSSITPEENRSMFIARLKEYAAAHPEQPILFARSAFNHGTPAPGPGLAILDEAVPDRPLVVHNTSEHALWVNSKMLELAGITDKPVDDPEMEQWIERDVHGHPTGLMREPAQELIERALPPMPMEDKVRILTEGVRYLNSFGITSAVALTGGLDDLRAYEELRKRGLLTLRIRQGFAAVSVKHKLTPDFLGALETARKTWHDDWISANLVKFFMDGAPTPPWYTAPEYNHIITELDRLGYQTTSHALSPAGVKMALDGYEAAQQANGARDRRQRIEHGSLIAPEDMPRVAQLKTIISTQPAFCCSPTMPSNPWNSLMKSGVTVAFSSDWPCSWPPSPLAGIEQAANRWVRQTVLSTGPGSPKISDGSPERVTPEQALLAYTRNGAYANFWENKVGSLETGKLADLVVLDRNILEVPSATIGQTHVLATIVGGKVVYGGL
jgi:predicted amidohydrolase YtcJ